MISPELSASDLRQSGLSFTGCPRVGTGMANGTFGELLQGSLQKDTDHFLVTLPIRKFSRVVFTPDMSSKVVTVTPGHKTKSRDFVQKLIDCCQFDFGGHLSIESELPEGKGMASSSADLIAAARAVESSLDRPIPMNLILTFMRAIEPTDGVMYPEFVTFFHRRVELGCRLGAPSPLKIVAIDEGGQIDTIDYNRRNYLFTERECAEYAELLKTLESAILRDDLAELGRVTTRSSILNQERSPKRYLDRIIGIGKKVRALGVVVTHSGPCLGLIFPDAPAYQRQIGLAINALSNLTDNVFVVDSL